VQSEWVRDRLRERHPGLAVEIEIVHTKGDKILDAPLAKIGDKGLFTKELEAAILERRVDIAVHSAKDMPTETPDGLAIAVFTAREDVRDVFVARGGEDAGSREGAGATAGAGAAAGAAGAVPHSLADLPAGAVVGTSSLRRRSQLLAARPDLELVDIRGNVETRLRKVEDEGMAGTVLAAAGLARLGRTGAVAFAFAFDDMLPAVGQGALAIETRADDGALRALLRPLSHESSAVAVRAERALLHTLEGGCQVPIAALGEIAGVDAAELRLRAFVGSLDGTDTLRLERRGNAAEPEALGRALAEDLLAAGADRILRGVRGETEGG
jgi:hydroxymethylbilane synthase